MEQYPRFPFEAGANSEPDFKNPRRKRRKFTQAQVARVATGAHPEEGRAEHVAQPAENTERASDLLAVLSGEKPATAVRPEQQSENEARQKKPEQESNQTVQAPDGMPQTEQPELAALSSADEASRFDTLPAPRNKYATTGGERLDNRPVAPQQAAAEEMQPMVAERAARHGANEEFVLHLNDEEATEHPSLAEQVIPLHEQAAGYPMQPQPEEVPYVLPPGSIPESGEQFAGPPQTQQEQFIQPLPAPSAEQFAAPAAAAEMSVAYAYSPELPNPYVPEVQQAEQASERQWVSQLPPEMVRAQSAYETPVSNAYYDAIRPGVATGARMASDYSEQTPSRREIKRALRDAEQRGVSRGLVTGVVGAVLFEHFRHRRQKQQLRKQLKQSERRSERLEKARYEIRQTASEQARKQDAAERQLQTVRTQLEYVRAAARTAERPLTSAAIKQERPAFTIPNEMPEQKPLVRSAGERMLDPNTEPVQAEAGIKIPAGHRLNTEGMVITELDKNGQVVEKPSFAYGHEYYRERAQESGPHAQRAMAAGEVALVAAALSQSGDTGQSRARFNETKPETGSASGDGTSGAAAAGNAGTIPNATIQGSLAAVRKSAGTSGGKGVSASRTSSARPEQPLWPWLVALAAVVIVLIFLI